MSSIFEVKNLNFSYGTNRVINDLCGSFAKGRITTLIGANGCGKSTLFNLMTKNLKAMSGEILLEGKSVDEIKLREYARRTAIVHQYNTAPDDLSVEKLVSYGRTPYYSFGASKNSALDEEKINQALEITNTQSIKDKPISKLSGGQKQRVWIAMALAQDTDILFLDEPTTYLDIRYQLEILKLVRKLNSEHGMTIIMVLHDINQSLYYSDDIAAMKDGKIIAQGAADKIITSDLIKEVYDVELSVSERDGKPFVFTI